MTSFNFKFVALKALKRVLDLAISVYLILLVIVIITGGFEVTLLGVTIKANHLHTPLQFLIPLILMRLIITMSLVNLAVLLGSLFLCLLSIEIGIRLWDPPISKLEMTQLHRASPIYGWDLVPGSSGVGFLGESYRINASGFRDREHEAEKQPGIARIMVIGDSFTFGPRVNLEDTYPKQLKKALNRQDIPCEVINCGVIGYNMWQHYEVLKRKVLSYRPDLVILGLFLNDLSASIFPYEHPDTYQGINPFENRGVSGIMSHSSLWNFLKNANAIYEYKNRYRRGYSYLKTIEERKKEWGPQNPENPDYRIMSGKLEKKMRIDFSETLGKFVKLAKSKGAGVLAVMIPDSVQLDEPHLQAVNRFVQQTCDNIGVPFLDVTSVLESQEDHSSLFLHPFDAHNSPKGLRLIGQAIANQIIKLKLISS